MPEEIGYASAPKVSNEDDDREETSLRSIYNQLEEISSILNGTEVNLDFAVNGNANTDASDKANGGNITVTMIQAEIDSIRRKSNSISGMTNRLLGN